MALGKGKQWKKQKKLAEKCGDCQVLNYSTIKHCKDHEKNLDGLRPSSCYTASHD